MPPSDGFTTRPVYMGTHGLIASGHYLAARAGQRMFDKGGNAIDATVASGFALNLLEPQNNGLGGEGPILIHTAKEGKVFSINGQGFPVYQSLRRAIAGLSRRFRDEWPTSATVYLPDDKVPAVGDLHKNRDWAATLKKVVEAETKESKRGREAAIQSAIDYWYKGEVAEKIVAFMEKTAIRDASGD